MAHSLSSMRTVVALAVVALTFVACNDEPGPSVDDGSAAYRDLSATYDPLDAGVLDLMGPVPENLDGSVAWSSLLAGPAASRQVIYLALVDRFANGDPSNDSDVLPSCTDVNDPQKFHGGDLVGLRDRLDYLAELGVTTVWITPVTLQSVGPPGRCAYHGYWADYADPDDGALDPRFGRAGDLSALADALHARGMALILDQVVNHPGDHARVVTQHWDWFHDPASCSGIIECPYRSGISDFAQERADVATYLDLLAAGWVRRFALDGIRMDTARHVAPAYFHDHWFPSVRAQRAGLYTVAEVFDEGSWAAHKSYIDAGFDGSFTFPLRRALVDAFGKGGSVDGVAGAVGDELATFGVARARTMVNFVDNHDVQRFVNEPGIAVSAVEIRARLELALVAIYALPGIPQLYMGDELGLYGGPDPDNRRDMPSWAWSAAGRTTGGTNTESPPNPQHTFALLRALADLRRDHRALTDGDYRELWRQTIAANANLYAFLRSDATSGDRAIVALHNGGSGSNTVSIPVADAGVADGTVWRDVLGAHGDVTVAGGVFAVSLPARTAALFVPR